MGSPVPAWAVDNRARFLRAPRAAGDSPCKPFISAAAVYRSGIEARSRAGLKLDKADGSGTLTTAGRIVPPPDEVKPDADYYRNEDNHPDILSTILDTARVTAGYNPATGSANTPESAEKQHNAFLSFLEEVDEYYAYLTLETMQTRQVKNTSLDCAGLLADVAAVIQAAVGSAGQRLTEAIQNTIKAAAERVTKNVTTNSVVDTVFNNVNLPAPTTDSSNRDPRSAVCFSIVGMTRTVRQNNKSTTDSSSEYLYITAATYRLRSASVSAYANYLAGSTITPAERVIPRFTTLG